MAVRIQKPTVNVREKLAELERPIGINGAALMATNTPQDAFSLIGAGRKNILINGGMQIWQRGTSFLNLPNQGATNYTADRWNATRYSSGDHDVTRQEVNYLGFQYALRSERSTGDSSNTSRYINHPIESSISRTLAGKNVVLSFYARRGAGAATTAAVNGSHITAYIVYHVDNSFLDDGMFYVGFKNASTSTAAFKAIILSTDFQKFELTGFIPSNVRQIGIAFGTPEGIPTAVANDYFDITGVQLEEGRVATPFEHRSIGEELALCQRYFYTLEQQQNSGGITGTATNTVTRYQFPVEMRVAPTASIITAGSWILGNDYSSNYTASTASIIASSLTKKGGRIVIGGFAAFNTNFFVAGTDSSGTAIIGLNSEL
jgi:hypothetical protein